MGVVVVSMRSSFDNQPNCVCVLRLRLLRESIIPVGLRQCSEASAAWHGLRACAGGGELWMVSTAAESYGSRSRSRSRSLAAPPCNRHHAIVTIAMEMHHAQTAGAAIDKLILCGRVRLRHVVHDLGLRPGKSHLQICRSQPN